MMSDRTLIPTFVFWAFLTIITPTLILLSENSNADHDLNGNITETMKVRRMIGHTQINNIIRTPPPPPAKSVVEEELASAPAPAPTPPRETSARAAQTGSHSLHNHTITSNSTVDELRLSSSNVHVQDKQTNVTST